MENKAVTRDSGNLLREQDNNILFIHTKNGFAYNLPININCIVYIKKYSENNSDGTTVYFLEFETLSSKSNIFQYIAWSYKSKNARDRDYDGILKVFGKEL